MKFKVKHLDYNVNGIHLIEATSFNKTLFIKKTDAQDIKVGDLIEDTAYTNRLTIEDVGRNQEKIVPYSTDPLDLMKRRGSIKWIVRTSSVSFFINGTMRQAIISGLRTMK